MSKLSDRRREVRTLDLATAERDLAELRRELFNLRFRKERGDVKNNREFPRVKKDIARLLQHITELRHTEAMEAAGLAPVAEPEVTPETTPEVEEPQAKPRASRARKPKAEASAETQPKASAEATSEATSDTAQEEE